MASASARGWQRVVLMLILLAAAAGRLVLALVVYPGVGFAGDMNDFVEWSASFARTGPGTFYADDPDANYPPLSILMFAGLRLLSDPAAAVLGTSAAHAFVVLIKLPSVLADVVSVGVLYLLGRDLRAETPRPGAGLVAAALFAVVPTVWYVSALWGQIDSVLIMFSVLALWFLCRHRFALAAFAAAAALMIKPQGVLIVLVVVVVAVAELAGRNDAGRRRVPRLIVSLAAPAMVVLGLLTVFGYRLLAGPALRTVPIVGDLAGFYAQSVSTGKLFPVLTANAFNVWALVGHPPLASTIGTGRSVWLFDAGVLGADPVRWNLIGLLALLVATLLVVIGLIIRRDAVAILFGYTVLSYAFFAFPTRVHERYLLPAFAGAAALAGVGLLRAVAYLFAGLLNLVNLHAVLAAPLSVVSRISSRTRVAVGSGGPARGSGGRGSGGGGTGARGLQPQSGRAGSISLPWADPARAEQVVSVVAIAQTGIGLLLVLGWSVFSVVALRRRVRSSGRHR